MLELRDSARILNWLASFHIFHSCTILLYSICHAGSVMDFLHCNLGELVWRIQIQTENQRFYFPYFSILLEKLSKLWPGNSCFVFRKKYLGFNLFFILFSLWFKVWLKHSQDVHLCFVFLFSHGMELLLFKRFHNLTMKGENYQLDLSKLLIVF